MKRRKPAYGALVVIGLALMALAISSHLAFIGAGALFIIAGATGLMRERRMNKDGDAPT
jgi:hypothetical protein